MGVVMIAAGVLAAARSVWLVARMLEGTTPRYPQ